MHGGVLQFGRLVDLERQVKVAEERLASVQKDHGLHIFELPELDGYLTAAGFESFKPQTYGSVLVFSAQKQKIRDH